MPEDLMDLFGYSQLTDIHWGGILYLLETGLRELSAEKVFYFIFLLYPEAFSGSSNPCLHFTAVEDKVVRVTSAQVEARNPSGAGPHGSSDVLEHPFLD